MKVLVKYKKYAIYSVAFWTKSFVAIPIALLSVGLLQTGQAQTKPISNTPGAHPAQENRNLVVQAATTSTGTTSINNSQRVALVIGNAAYKDAPLANPVNDARAIAQALKDSGFTVITRENIDQRGMLSALREFGDRLRGGGTGLFYYAGHGMQIKGRNYLIPVGATIEREDEVAYNAVDAQAVLDKMEAAGNVANIMILDACRNNPFTRNTRSGQAGLAQMDAPVGTLVAYATSPGAVASDGAGANGLYTQHLLTAIRQPSSKVEDVFKQVRANVRRDSLGKQVPWESTSLEGDFYFRGGPNAALPMAVPAPAQATQATQAGLDASLEAALWDAVKGSTLPIEVRAYLNRYPNGRFAALAKARLTQLQPAAVVPAAITQTPAISMNDAADNERRAQDKADVDRRTEEILASLASAGPGQMVKPSASMSNAVATPGFVRPAPASNKFGFSVGDRWRYQTVDKFKQEVTGNWSRNINDFNADGSIQLSGGEVTWAADGGIKSLKFPNGSSSDYSPAFKWLPANLTPGATEAIKHQLVWHRADGINGTEQREGTLKVLGTDKVKVPAGEFDALKIEMTGFGNGKNLSSNNNYIVKFKEIWWYVPALRNFVASEFEQRDSGGKITFFTRHELTSFSVRGAENLAQR